MKFFSGRRPECSPGFCAVVLVAAWYDPEICGAFLLSAAVHELGHLAAMKLLKQPIYGFRWNICGAMIETTPMEEWTAVRCALAGPAAGILFGCGILWVWPLCAIISLGLSAGNLLPIYPMDGGRILRGVLLLWMKEQAAMRILRAVAYGTAALLMVAACWGTVFLQVGIWPIFAALAALWRTGVWEK